MNNREPIIRSEADSGLAAFMTKVYMWMSVALVITGVVAYYVSTNEALIEAIIVNRIMFWALIISEVALVWYLSANIHKMSSGNATAMFMVYAALNGATLSIIFLIYTMGSIANTFFITAGTFAVMSAYGYFTKSDLTKWGNILFMALIGVIIASVVNVFMGSGLLYWIITYVGVLVFTGLIAYDTQKLKNIYNGIMTTKSDEVIEIQDKSAIMGALSLYLDFINLFLLLLRFFGGGRD
ncbi:inner membrane protein YbhL [Neptunitalea chrysea]|uniref:Inner membrane protein YbhL n=1 Tax=Neptunitalea chrysea TaxID=1647581 RepID=A0A9W6B4H7_9FLAO|nr:Bax inhibitor-1/YccA family protein [Neptunitalea chrysea]GLB51134.1 inner membrane protein YbhL [Neptunitalea chrysea]